jgi:hypothetical protein
MSHGELKPLIPPDTVQCQAEKPNGHSFMTIGGRPGLERCTNKPTMLVAEAHPGEDGRIGSMTLCDDCFAVFQKQQPAGFAIFKRLP